ncbi:MAG TPA: hypothetical protein VMW54_07395 [Terriglobia bacterium]|nr:hypothetical protein [Terriglobia bacterium]
MSSLEHTSLADLADTIALRIQELRSEGILKEAETLLNLDYTSEAADAPFLFDMVRGTLHRNNCTAIPASSKSTVYAVWELKEGDDQLACPVCRPQSDKPSHIQADGTADILFGIMSFLDQFSSVLRERGKEYRKSNQGKVLAAELEEILVHFGQAGRQFANAVHSFDLAREPLATERENSQPEAAPQPHPTQPERKPGGNGPSVVVSL